MKLFTGWVMSAGLVLTAVAANAQGAAPRDIGPPPYRAVSDFDGPYAAMPPEAPMPGYGPILLPPREVYTVVRESGFSPLGIPHQRGMFYVIAVIDRHGEDGRLVIDARDGRIVRFMPAYRMDGNLRDNAPRTYPPYAPAGPLPPISDLRGPPRPPASVPKIASRMPQTVPMPKPSPPRAEEAKPLAEKPAAAPTQQSATVQTKPVDTPAASQAAPPVVEAKPAPPPTQPKQQSAAVQMKPADTPATPQAAPAKVEAKPAATTIQPTQEMPKVQGLE
jgi:hypothetical protein